MSVNFFASFMVLPEQEDTVEVDINEKNLRRDTYRASGAGIMIAERSSLTFVASSRRCSMRTESND